MIDTNRQNPSIGNMNMNMNDAVEFWNQYYDADEGRELGIRDESFYDLEMNAILGAAIEAVGQFKTHELHILELGFGTGFLASNLVTAIETSFDGEVSYTGVDISESGFRKAGERNLQHCKFEKDDFLSFLKESKEKYDLIVTQRTIMAILDSALQKELLELIRAHMREHGQIIFSEGSQQAFEKMDELRNQLGVASYGDIWHCNYVDEHMVRQIFPSVSITDFSSLFWLATRVIYPYFEQPKHNTRLHQFAATLPQEGDYGLFKLFVSKV